MTISAGGCRCGCRCECLIFILKDIHTDSHPHHHIHALPIYLHPHPQDSGIPTRCGGVPKEIQLVYVGVSHWFRAVDLSGTVRIWLVFSGPTYCFHFPCAFLAGFGRRYAGVDRNKPGVLWVPKGSRGRYHTAGFIDLDSDVFILNVLSRNNITCHSVK